jgi:hypothetical protein
MEKIKLSYDDKSVIITKLNALDGLKFINKCSSSITEMSDESRNVLLKLMSDNIWVDGEAYDPEVAGLADTIALIQMFNEYQSADVEKKSQLIKNLVANCLAQK